MGRPVMIVHDVVCFRAGITRGHGTAERERARSGRCYPGKQPD